MAEIEVFQGAAIAPYEFVVRDAEPPRYWYGARRENGDWRFERLADERLAEMTDLAAVRDTAAQSALAEAFAAAAPPGVSEPS